MYEAFVHSASGRRSLLNVETDWAMLIIKQKQQIKRLSLDGSDHHESVFDTNESVGNNIQRTIYKSKAEIPGIKCLRVA